MESGTQRHADSRTAKHLLPESTTKCVEFGTYDVICQFCTVKGVIVESEVLKAQNCAFSKFSFPMHSNVPVSWHEANSNPTTDWDQRLDPFRLAFMAKFLISFPELTREVSQQIPIERS